MDRKTSFVVYPADFLAAVHNFKKGQIVDLIVALCQLNLYGKVDLKISDIVQEKLTSLQKTIDMNNARYAETCEKRRSSGSRGGKQKVANAKQTFSKQKSFANNLPAGEEEEQDKEQDKESDNVFIKNKNKERDNVDKLEIGCVPSVEDVAAYAKESGYTIDPVAFVKWNSERGWMNGKKFIGVDWRKAVRKWYCKENGLSMSEMETMADLAGGILSKIKVVQDGIGASAEMTPKAVPNEMRDEEHLR